MDVLRLASAVEVVLYHVVHCGIEAGTVHISNPVLRAVLYHGSAFGQQAVLVFFVLSGFWIAAAVDRLRDEPRFWQAYLVRRFSRLLVVLVPALLLGGAMDVFGAVVLRAPVYHDASAVAWGAWAPITASLHGTALIGNLLFLQDFLTAPFGSNSALWSLSCEFWYYLIYPACILALRRRLTLPLLAVALLVFWPSLAETFPIWLMGATLYHVERAAGRAAPRATAQLAVPLGIVGLLGALVAARYQLTSAVAGEWLVGLATAMLLFALLRHATGAPALIESMARLGASASYSLYLAHMPLAILLGALVGAIGMADSIGSRLIIVVVVLVWGWLFSRLFECRTDALRRLAKALLFRQQAPVAAVDSSTYRG